MMNEDQMEYEEIRIELKRFEEFPMLKLSNRTIANMAAKLSIYYHQEYLVYHEVGVFIRKNDFPEVDFNRFIQYIEVLTGTARVKNMIINYIREGDDEYNEEVRGY